MPEYDMTLYINSQRCIFILQGSAISDEIQQSLATQHLELNTPSSPNYTSMQQPHPTS